MRAMGGVTKGDVANGRRRDMGARRSAGKAEDNMVKAIEL